MSSAGPLVVKKRSISNHEAPHIRNDPLCSQYVIMPERKSRLQDLNPVVVYIKGLVAIGFMH